MPAPWPNDTNRRNSVIKNYFSTFCARIYIVSCKLFMKLRLDYLLCIEINFLLRFEVESFQLSSSCQANSNDQYERYPLVPTAILKQYPSIKYIVFITYISAFYHPSRCRSSKSGELIARWFHTLFCTDTTQRWQGLSFPFHIHICLVLVQPSPIGPTLVVIILSHDVFVQVFILIIFWTRLVLMFA